ncbi:DUF1836 domain-containing protein, partial [Streptococcus canis]
VTCWNEHTRTEDHIPPIILVACQTVKDYHQTIFLSQEATK